MMSSNKYDPEDIESLMLFKQFHELYPEEKEFVLRHLENEEEYESMRRVLFEIKEIKSKDGLLKPDAGLKKELLKAFNAEKKSRFAIWLNSLFTAPDRSFFGQRGVQLGFSFAIVAAAIFLYNLKDEKPVQIAENKAIESPLILPQDSAVEPAIEQVETAMIEEQSIKSTPAPVPVEEDVVLSDSYEILAEETVMEKKNSEPVIAHYDQAEMDLAPPAESLSSSDYTFNSSPPISSAAVATDISTSVFSVAAVSLSMESTSNALELLFTAQ